MRPPQLFFCYLFCYKKIFELNELWCTYKITIKTKPFSTIKCRNFVVCLKLIEPMTTKIYQWLTSIPCLYNACIYFWGNEIDTHMPKMNCYVFIYIFQMLNVNYRRSQKEITCVDMTVVYNHKSEFFWFWQSFLTVSYQSLVQYHSAFIRMSK